MKGSTREIVLETIERLGFRPNRAARALAGGPIQSVTVLTSNTTLYGQRSAATEYLLGLGHQTVHYVAIPSSTQAGQRLEGWRPALERAGVEVPEPVPASVSVVGFDDIPQAAFYENALPAGVLPVSSAAVIRWPPLAARSARPPP